MPNKSFCGLYIAFNSPSNETRGHGSKRSGQKNFTSQKNTDLAMLIAQACIRDVRDWGPFYVGSVAPSRPVSQKLKAVWTSRSIPKLRDRLCRKTASRMAAAYSGSVGRCQSQVKFKVLYGSRVCWWDLCVTCLLNRSGDSHSFTNRQSPAASDGVI